MAKNQSTYTLKINAELGNLQKILNEAKASLTSFVQSGNAPKGLEKAFEKINDLLGQISDKTGKPLDLKGLTSAGKDLNTIQENFRAIIRLVGEFDDLSDDLKISFLSTEEQNKIIGAVNALKAYATAAEESAKKIKLLEAAQKTLAKDQSTLDKAQKKTSGIDSKKSLKEAELFGAKTKLQAAQGMEEVDPEKVAKYQAKVVKLQADLDKLTKEQKEANDELKVAQSAYDTSAQSVAKLEKEADRASKESLHKLKEEAKNLGISLNGLKGHNAAKQIEILTERLEAFKNETLNSGRPAFDAIKKGFAQAEDAAEKMGKEVSEATEVVKDMDETVAAREAFEAKIKSFLGLAGAAQVLRAALRDAMATITELDATMTEMAVVTDLTVGDYWDQLPEYSQRASELGVSINSAYKAATLYYQQGLKTNEVTALSAETLKLAKIAGIDAAEATDKMTAALRGFNMELNEASAQKIADVYSDLAAITAADVDEISTAMTKTASIASSAGMEFETTAAFLSQIIETTRESAETAGTAMKTVIARFQELKKDPSEIGEVDGEIVDANAIEGALRSVGVSLRDSAGQFRKLDEVFLELSSKWNTLDKNTQRYIATIAAGSRQQSRFIAMMQDYNRTQELVTAANNSAGASQKQFEKTMESLSSKVEKLKNAWHEFTMGIMDSDLVKFGVDVLTKFLEVINKATSALNGIGGSLTKIIGIVAIFNIGKALYEKISGPISGLFLNEMPKIARESGFKVGTEWKKGAEAAMAGEALGQQPNTSNEQKTQKVSAIQKLSTGLKDLSTARKQKRYEAAAENFENVQGEAYNDPKKYNSAVKKLSKAQKDWNGEIADTDTAWKNVSEGITEAGKNISNAGTALSIFGGILSSIGLEDAGEGFAKFGNTLMIGGTAISTIIPLISLLGITIDKESNKMVIAGIKTQLAWWWVVLIVAAIAALIVGIIALAAAMKKNSPEGKLKAAKEAAERAGEAADEAAEKFDHLNSSLEELSDKYKGLDELTRGTKEWNEAVQNINSSVLDLISKYPELAKFVKNQNGVLTIDLESPDVQNILDGYSKQAVIAQAMSHLADLNLLSAQADIQRSKLGSMVYDFYYDGTFSEFNEETQQYEPVEGYVSEGAYATRGRTEVNLTDDQIDKFAKALASGRLADKNSREFSQALDEIGISAEQFEILNKSTEDSISSIREYGETLLQQQAQEMVAYDAIANSTLGLVDTMGMADERIKQMFNVLDGDAYKAEYDKWMEYFNNAENFGGHTFEKIMGKGNWAELISERTGGQITEDVINEALRASGKQDAKVQAGRKLQYTENNETKTIDLDMDELKRALSNYFTTNKLTAQAENFDAFMSRMLANLPQSDALQRALFSETGDELTTADLTELKTLKDDGAILKAYNALPKSLKELFSLKDFQGKIDSAISGAEEQFISSKAILKDRTISGANAKQSHGIAKVAKEMTDAEKGDFISGLNTITEDLTEEQKAKVLSSIAGMSNNPRDLGKWQSMIDTLAEFGIDAQEFISSTATVLDARYSTGDLSAMGVSQELISHYNNATGEELKKFHDTFDQWRKHYKIANDKKAKTEDELINKVIDAMIEGYEKQIDAYEETSNAITEANDKLISHLSEKIQADRQQRDNEKMESDIADSRNRLAYLAADTSGGNALERLQLQEDIKQAEQDYEDSLIDQAITKLEDANAQAAEQRERQIELARQQLEAYSNSSQIIEDAKYLITESTQMMQSGVNLTDTAIGQLLAPDRFVSEYEESQFWTELNTQMSDLIKQAVHVPETTVTTVTKDVPAGSSQGNLIFNRPNKETVATTVMLKYKQGGLADFTGPAWLDGTPSKPEYILNAAQTERFFSLIDVLEHYGTDKSDKSSGDNYFDIEINVEKLENDYDVEQVANKIRNMIYEDATYRNVNAINHLR